MPLLRSWLRRGKLVRYRDGSWADRLDEPTLLLSRRDTIGFRDLAGGTAALGNSGSGKTTMFKQLFTGFLGKQTTSAIITSVKPDDHLLWKSVANRADARLVSRCSHLARTSAICLRICRHTLPTPQGWLSSCSA